MWHILFIFSLASVQILDSLSQVWNAYNKAGEYEALVSETRGWLYKAVDDNDTVMVLKSGLAMAQAFIFTEQFDSVETYLGYIQKYETAGMDPQIGVGINTIRGIYSVKSASDYSKALRYYYEGLSWAEREGNVNNVLAVLCNITQIFYILHDESGKSYADSACALMQSNDVSEYMHAHVLLSKAQMEYLSGNRAEAADLVGHARNIAETEGLMSLLTGIYLLSADIFMDEGSMAEAGKCYEEALRFRESSEPSISALACLHYGNYYRRQGRHEDAIAAYELGAGMMGEAGRKDFYAAMAETYYMTVAKDSALKYYRLNLDLARRDSSRVNERQFNELLRSYQKAEYENELQKHDLELLKERKRLNSILYIAIMAVIVALSATVLYLKQKAMYRKLACQHERFRRRMDSVAKTEGVFPRHSKTEDADMELFKKMERLMTEDKVFSIKGLTLDKMAEIMGTNRTYVSNAVNKYAQMDFISYVDMYRIKEAAGLISKNGNIPVKGLADAVGYNSISVFYKAFRNETGVTPGQYAKSLHFPVSDS